MLTQTQREIALEEAVRVRFHHLQMACTKRSNEIFALDNPGPDRSLVWHWMSLACIDLKFSRFASLAKHEKTSSLY